MSITSSLRHCRGKIDGRDRAEDECEANALWPVRWRCAKVSWRCEAAESNEGGNLKRGGRRRDEEAEGEKKKEAACGRAATFCDVDDAVAAMGCLPVVDLEQRDDLKSELSWRRDEGEVKRRGGKGRGSIDGSRIACSLACPR